MFYILNFEDHSFQTCHYAAEAEAVIQALFRAGADMDDLEIVNGDIDESRMSVVEFENRFWKE